MMLILTFQSGGKLGPASCHYHDNEVMMVILMLMVLMVMFTMMMVKKMMMIMRIMVMIMMLMLMVMKKMRLILTLQSGGKLGPASCQDHENEDGAGDDVNEDGYEEDNDDADEDDDVNPHIPITGEIGLCFLS